MIESHTDQSQRSLVIDTLAFQVPCKRFRIRCAVAKGERLPLVTEYVLRLLKTSRALPIISVGSFFGLSSNETTIVLQDLSSQNLIQFSENRREVRLSQLAEKEFYSSPDGIPRPTAIEHWLESVSVDWVSHNIAWFSERSQNFRAFISLPVADFDSMSRCNETARKIFNQNFDEYVERFKKNLKNQRYSIYSIADVEPGDDFQFTLNLKISVSVDNALRIDHSFTEFESDTVANSRGKVIEAVVDCIQSAKNSLTSTRDLRDFAKIYGDTVLPNFLRYKTFDIAEYLNNVHGIGCGRIQFDQKLAEKYRKMEVVPIFGNIYLDRNFDLLKQHFDSSNQGEIEIGTKHCLWIKPTWELWGRNDEVFEAAKTIRRLIKKSDQASQLTLIGEHDENNDGRGFYELRRALGYGHAKPFDRGIECTPGTFLKGMEILLSPGRFVFAVYHYLIDREQTYPFPVGIFSTNAAIVESFVRHAKDALIGSNQTIVNEWWQTPAKKEKMPVQIPSASVLKQHRTTRNTLTLNKD